MEVLVVLDEKDLSETCLCLTKLLNLFILIHFEMKIRYKIFSMHSLLNICPLYYYCILISLTYKRSFKGIYYWWYAYMWAQIYSNAVNDFLNAQAWRVQMLV
jgi:hypothetical protein